MINISEQQFDLINQAFTKQSEIYDEYESSNKILYWMLQQVDEIALKYLKQRNKIIELSSGTGTDDVFTQVPQMENFQVRFPLFLKLLNKIDEKFSRKFPFNLIGDHLILFAEYNPLII